MVGLCDDHASLVAMLDGQYGESPVAMGLTGGSYIMETFVNPEARTWTVVLTQPNGMACAIMSGENFEKQAPTDKTGHRI